MLFVLSESRFKHQSQINFDLVRYNFINIRPENNACGVAVYALNTIKFKEKKDQSYLAASVYG